MTIEQLLLKDYGETREPCFATWLLRDGTLINGSIEGRQRDIDHRCISHYYKRSKFEDPGSAYLYILKFMRRGNIRVCCNEFGYGFEFTKQPSLQQLKTIRRAYMAAIRKAVPFTIDRRIRPFHVKNMRMAEFETYLYRYTDLMQHLEPIAV